MRSRCPQPNMTVDNQNSPPAPHPSPGSAIAPEQIRLYPRLPMQGIAENIWVLRYPLSLMGAEIGRTVTFLGQDTVEEIKEKFEGKGSTLDNGATRGHAQNPNDLAPE
jgi:hypothetical protein